MGHISENDVYGFHLNQNTSGGGNLIYGLRYSPHKINCPIRLIAPQGTRHIVPDFQDASPHYDI